MRREHLLKTVYAVGILVLVVASFVLGMAQAENGMVSAQSGLSAPTDPDSPSAIHNCAVDHVAAYENRMHVHCSNAAPNSVYYFAYPVGGSYSANANRFLAVGNSAYALGHHLDILYNSDSAANPPGCLVADCRIIEALVIVP